MQLDPRVVLQQIANLKVLYPEIWDEDEQLLTDCLEAQTEMDEFLTVLVDRMQEAKSFAGGIATRIAELELRLKRYENRELAYRNLAFKIMTSAEVRKRELTEATLSIVNGQPKLVGEFDPYSLPDDYVKIIRAPDRMAIKRALEAGETVPGYQLSNAEPHINIRTK